MSLAENLLNSIPTNSNSRIAGSGSDEPHIVVDATRTIIVPDILKTIAVKGDKDVETVTIDCIRYWDGNDLSEFSVSLMYELQDGKERQYTPKKITKNDAEGTFSFDWVIGKEVTRNSGGITFWIVAQKLDGNGTLLLQWSSFKNSDCSIADGGFDEIYDPDNEEDRDLVQRAINAASMAERAASSAEIAKGAASTSATNAEESAKRAEKAANKAEQVTGGIQIDPDFKTEGMAADAFLTGKRLSEIEAIINYEKIRFTTFNHPSKTNFEYGESVSNVQFSWTLSKKAKSITVNGAEIDPMQTSYIATGTFTSDQSWTIIATDERGGTDSRTVKITFNYEDIKFTSFEMKNPANGNLEKGSSVTGVVLEWELNKNAESIQVVRKGVGGVQNTDTLKADSRSYKDNGVFTENTSWEVTVTGKKLETDKKTAEIKFIYYRVYFGKGTTSASSDFGDAFVKELQSLTTEERNFKFTIEGGVDNEYLYCAIPSELGNPTFKIGESGNVGGFEYIKQIIVPTGYSDSYGYEITMTYNFYRSSEMLVDSSSLNVYIS